VAWFAKARTVLAEQGARPLRATVDYDEALMYVRRSKPGDAERARPPLDAALAQFRSPRDARLDPTCGSAWGALPGVRCRLSACCIGVGRRRTNVQWLERTDDADRLGENLSRSSSG